VIDNSFREGQVLSLNLGDLREMRAVEFHRSTHQSEYLAQVPIKERNHQGHRIDDDRDDSTPRYRTTGDAIYDN
jgi:hypothetical protein